VSPRRNPFREFFAGIGLLGRGFAMYGTNPGLFLLGIIPALIAGILIIGVFVLLLYFIGDLSSTVTWFAKNWSSPERDGIQVIAGIAIIGISGLLAVVTFTSVTLAIGDPFYEKISEKVEQKMGGLPDPVSLPFWKELRRGLTESVRMIGISAMTGIPLFLLGFIPVVGQTVVPAIGALVGGWFLATELVGVPFARRGLRLRDRRRVLKQNRPLAVGFGAAVFLCFLVPLGAVIVTPAAVAGGTMLARRVLEPAGAS
jgi:CysZ protein